MENIDDMFDLIDSEDFKIESKDEIKKVKRKKTVKKVELDLKKDHIIRQKTKDSINIQLKRAKDLNFLPDKNTQIRIVTQVVFSPLSILKLIESREPLLECYIVLFSMNQASAYFFEDIINKYPNCNFVFLLSTVINASKFPKSIYLKNIAKEKDNVIVLTAHSHAKMLAVKTQTNHFVVEGSGNFSAQAKIEQYIIDNDKVLFDFHSIWINTLDKTYKYKDFEKIGRKWRKH